MPEEGSIPAAPPTDAAPATPPASILGGEQPPAGTTQTDTPKDDKATSPEPKPAVPEKYEFKVPEGFTLDPAAVSAFEPVAKELGLGQEQAQKLVDLYAQQQAASQKAIADGWAKTQQGWREELTADKEFGGTAFNATQNQANSVLSKYASKDEIKLINDMGLGNFPPLVKVLARVGKAIGEDALVIGKTNPTRERSIAERLYGDSTS